MPGPAPVLPSSAPAAATAAATPEMRRTAQELEGVFLAQLLRGLTAGLGGPGQLGDQDDPFASMLQDEYAKLISRSGGIGIADAVLREMLKMQEVR